MKNVIRTLLLSAITIFPPLANSSCFVDVDINCSSINNEFEWKERTPLIRQHLLSSGEVQLNYKNCILFAQLIKTECQISKPLQTVFVDLDKEVEVTEFVSSIDKKINTKANLPQSFINYFNDVAANRILENNKNNLGSTAEVILTDKQKGLIEQFIDIDRSASEMKLSFPCSLKVNQKIQLECGLTLTCTSSDNTQLGNQITIQKSSTTYNSNKLECSGENLAQTILDRIHSMGRTANTALDLPNYSFTQFTKMPRINQASVDIKAILKDRYNFTPQSNDLSLVVAATMLGVALRSESPPGVMLSNMFNNIDPTQKNVPTPSGQKTYNNYAAHVAEVFAHMLIYANDRAYLSPDYSKLHYRGLFSDSRENSNFFDRLDDEPNRSFHALVKELGSYDVENFKNSMLEGRGYAFILGNSPDQKVIGPSYAVAVQGFKLEKWKENVDNPYYGRTDLTNLFKINLNTASRKILVEKSATVLVLYTSDGKILNKTIKLLRYYNQVANKSFTYSVLSDYNKEPSLSDPIILGTFSARPWPLSSVAVAQLRLNNKTIVRDEIVKSTNCSALSTGTIKINNIEYIFSADPAKKMKSCGDLLTKIGYPKTSKKESYQGYFTYSCNGGGYVVQQNNCSKTKLDVCSGSNMEGGTVNADLSNLSNIKYSCDNFSCKNGFIKNGQSCTCTHSTGLKLKNGNFVALDGKAGAKCVFTCPTGTILSGDTCVAQGALCDYTTPVNVSNENSSSIYSINANDIYGRLPTEFGFAPDLNAVYEYVPGKTPISGYCRMLSCKAGFNPVLDSRGNISCTQNSGIPNKQINVAEYVNFSAGRIPGSGNCQIGFMKDFENRFCASALNPCEYGPDAYGFKTYDAKAPKECLFVGCKTGYRPIRWTAPYKWSKSHLDSVSNNGNYPMNAYGYFCTNNKDDYALDGVGIVRNDKNQVKIIAATTEFGHELLRYLVKDPLDMSRDSVTYLGSQNKNNQAYIKISVNNNNYEFPSGGSAPLGSFPQGGMQPAFDSIGSIVTNPNCLSWNPSLRPLCESWKASPSRFEIYNCLERGSIVLNDFSCLSEVSKAPDFSSCIKVTNGVNTFDINCWTLAANKVLTLNQKKTRETIKISENVCFTKNGLGALDANKACKASACNVGYRLSQGSCI